MPFMGREICPQFPALNFPNTENRSKCSTSHHREHQLFPALHETASSLRRSKTLLAGATAVLDATNQEQSTKRCSAVELLASQPLRKPGCNLNP